MCFIDTGYHFPETLETVQRVRFEPDKGIAKIVLSWPAAFRTSMIVRVPTLCSARLPSSASSFACTATVCAWITPALRLRLEARLRKARS